FEHNGVDLSGLMRAVVELVTTREIQSGGSTITMQLARNFFLSTEQSFIRKFNEILLALRIEDELRKEEILTLYANLIYLGSRAYGLEAAAQVYYGQSAAELSLDQLALIAGLPKAPSAFNPLVNPSRAMTRRDWILRRMHHLGHIDAQQLEQALAAPMNASSHGPGRELEASYVAEMARQEAIDRFGLDAYTEGYRVFTTLDSTAQRSANQAVRAGLEAYDDRHGYRGPEAHHPDPAGWADILGRTSPSGALAPAIVSAVETGSAELLLRFGETGQLHLEGHPAIRRYINENARSAPIQDLTALLKPGDLIRVRRGEEGAWQLTQIPQAQAALVAIDPADGAIRALVGGFDFNQSNFNRATQAQRQPGSNFKPFVYAKALESGMTPATLINDAPVVFRDPHLERVWRPENDSGRFYGPTPLRKALYLSRNLVSIRILRQVGIQPTIDSMERFGFDPASLPNNLSLALGTQNTTPLAMAAGFTVFANGGYRVRPHIVDRIETEPGEVIYRTDAPRVCSACEQPAPEPEPVGEARSLEELFADDSAPATRGSAAEPQPPAAERVMDARVAYIMDSILKDAIKLGTGRRALALNRKDIAGKTGTTNGPRDVWFSGYSPHLAATVWMGFDENLVLGRNEYGSTTALPVWIDFMEDALANKPEILPPQPPGLITARIDPDSGQRVGPGHPGAVFEYFLDGQRLDGQGLDGQRLDGRGGDDSGLAEQGPGGQAIDARGFDSWGGLGQQRPGAARQEAPDTPPAPPPHTSGDQLPDDLF
ncbi:MAG: PBP1A family penicillin-binding protein, partial [Bacteroidales bacterium]|nr:PBP1A family penicillin-binding protein [Bacteroidales bacterium]